MSWQSLLSMRTIVGAIGTSVLLLAIGNVLLLLLLRAPAIKLSTLLSSSSSTSQQQHTGDFQLDRDEPLPKLLRWIGFQPRSPQTLDLSKVPPALHEGLQRCPRPPGRPSPSLIIHVDSAWQLQRVGNELIYIYSAYYDDRPAAGILPSIRVLALATIGRDVPIFCAVWYGVDAGVVPDRPLVVRATVNYEAGTGYGFDRQIYREYAYICPLPVSAEPFPTHVSVSSVQCVNRSYTTLVEVRRTPPTDHPPIEFGVCVTAGYGYLPPEELVEWVELNRMFGVAELNLYDTWYEPNMSSTFDYYAQRGLLTVHKLPHPRANHSSWFFNKVRNIRIIALNDCQLRNMYRYRFIVVIDTDEIIVPRTTSNYSALIGELDRLRDVPGVAGFQYVFLNIYYFLHLEQDTTKPFYLRTMRLRHRVPPRSYGYAPKSIVDPRQCSVAFNHYCARWLIPGPSQKLVRTFRVPFAVGSSHHYRRCGKFYSLTCDQIVNVTDDFMLRFEAELGARVVPILRDLHVLT